MKKTIICIAVIVLLLGAYVFSITSVRSYADEDLDSKIVMLIDDLAEYHSRQFTEKEPSCEINLSHEVCNDLAVRQSCITDMKKRIGARFVSVSVEVDGLTVSSDENGFDIIFNEKTVLGYRYPSATETDQMEFSVFHKVFLSSDLQIVSDEFSEEMITGFSNCEIVDMDAFDYSRYQVQSLQ